MEVFVTTLLLAKARGLRFSICSKYIICLQRYYKSSKVFTCMMVMSGVAHSVNSRE